jgi:phage terminase large subunit GpA-like protein
LENLISRWVRIWQFGGDEQKRKLQGFVNSSLAEPWKVVVVTSDRIHILKARCSLAPQTVPETAVALTAGIDPQKYGFWFCVRAWTRTFTSWLIHYGFLGDWNEVATLLFETAYPVVGFDRSLRIWRAAIDAGGGKFDEGLSMTEEAYFWIRKNGFGRGARVWATKGSSKPLAGKIHLGKMLDKTPSGKPIPGGLQPILIDTDKIKDMVYYRLGQAVEDVPDVDYGMPADPAAPIALSVAIKNMAQGAYLHAATGDDYAKQILAEEKRLNKRGLAEWVQVQRDNHLLDCEGLAMVLAEPEWPGGGVNLLPEWRPPQAQGARPTVQGNGEDRDGRLQYERPAWLNR